MVLDSVALADRVGVQDFARVADDCAAEGVDYVDYFEDLDGAAQ